MKIWAVIIKVQANTSAEAQEAAYRRIDEGGEPDAVLTGDICFPDPEIEGAEVAI